MRGTEQSAFVFSLRVFAIRSKVICISMNVTPGTILHVDDDESVRLSMAMLLRSKGYEVVSAADGAEALEFVSKGLDPDALILDFHLGPRTNGAEVAERIRSILSHGPPIIVLTGDATSARFPRILDTLVWLTSKPLNPQLLLAVLPSLVQLSRATRIWSNQR